MLRSFSTVLSCRIIRTGIAKNFDEGAVDLALSIYERGAKSLPAELAVFFLKAQQWRYQPTSLGGTLDLIFALNP